MKMFKFCKDFIMKCKGMFFTYIIINIVIGIIGIAIPLITGSVLNCLTYAKDLKLLVNLSLTYMMLSLINMFLGFGSSYIYIKIQTKCSYLLNTHVIRHLQNVSMLNFINTDTAYLNQKINNDSNAIIIFCINVVISIAVNCLTLIVTITLLMKINYKIGIMLVCLVSLYIVTYGTFKKPLYERAMAVKESQAEFFGKLNEQLFNIKFIKMHSVANIFAKRLDKTFTNVINKLVASQKMSYVYSSCDNIISLMAQMCIFLVGGYNVVQGKMQIGMFSIMSSYYYMMISSTRYFFNLGKNFQENKVSYNRIMEILDIKEQRCGEKILDTIDNIKITNVSFGYGEKKVFDNYNLELKKGNIYSMVGYNGAGKSTLISLILGLYINDYNGNIKYNDIDIEELNLYDIKANNIGVTEQEPILIPDTLINNITYGTEYDKERLNELIDILGLSKYILSLEKGLETVINEKSSNISGGEKQKISILRQLLKNPDVMIFDEPTSALDKESKEKFVNYLNKIKNDKIMIIISHDGCIEEICDETIVIGKK